MREIKFRAWHKIDNSIVDWKELCHNGFGSYAQNFFRRDDLILMQYTGLKDKNGKEIYEGDIILKHIEPLTKAKAEIVFFEGCFLGKWIGYDDELLFRFSSNRYTPNQKLEWFEIIGNIYEDPELLSKEV